MVRLVKETEKGFTVIANEAVRDSRLSWKARGIFAYMWSQANDWDFYVSELIKHAPEGREALKSGLKELERYGYLTRRARQNSNGKLDGTEWLLVDRSTRNTVDGKISNNTQKNVDYPFDGNAVQRETCSTENPLLRNNNNKKHQQQELTTTSKQEQVSDRKTDQTVQELPSESLLERKETKENTNENENENERIVDDSSTYRQNAVKPGLVGGYTNQVKFIIDYLNQRVGTHYRPTSYENKKLIKARLNEGATVDDFKTVIDKKVNEWLNTDMKRYLRPKTLFAPTHFDDYLNDPVRQQNNDGGTLGNAAPGWTV